MRVNKMGRLLCFASLLFFIFGCVSGPESAGKTGKKSAKVSSIFKLTGAVGWTGEESIIHSESVLNDGPAWTITNMNWNSAAVFTVDLGEKRLGEFMGFECKVRSEDGDLVWKKFSLDVALEDSNLGPILSDETFNKTIGTANTEKSGEIGQIANITIPFTGLDASVSMLTGKQEFAIGISAPQGSKFTIFDMRLIPLAPGSIFWHDAPSLKEALLPNLDYFGFSAVAAELKSEVIVKGLSHHGNSTTVGNEWKPDYILRRAPAKLVPFTAEDGKTYEMPENLFFDVMDETLSIARDAGLELRGHTLVWHNQTPKWFFRKGFKNSGELVSVEEMTARQEWYIKGVLEHIKDWEARENDGKRIVKHWDVVNEAVSDSADVRSWLRMNSDWYLIFKDDSYIVNAFVLANKYAPKDVRLVYNDYNSYMANKTSGIVNVVKAIQANPKARIDAVGMQSHLKIDFPSIASFKTAVEAFLALGVDIQITELDIHSVMKTDAANERLGEAYANFFKLFLDYRKTDYKNGIEGVTIWGISDAGTWLTSHHKVPSFPLLFDAWFNIKPSFNAVLKMAEEYKE